MKILLIPLMILLALHLAIATVTLEVTAFNCSPDEVTVTEGFSCTATVENSGDETGSLTTATLYADSGNWLEESSYAEVVNSNINSGASADLVFEGLRAQKSGEFGFSRITLDSVSDTYPADNSIEVNVIDAITVLSQSANSAAASTGTVDSSAQVTVGGNVDIVVSFSVVSGGCSIGTQASSASFPDLSDGQSVSQTWTITMGTSNCVYSISSVATSNPSGTATKTDSTTKTITCSGSTCTTTSTSSSSSSSSSSGSSGSAGGGGATTTKEKEKEETPNLAPEYGEDDNTIDLNDYESWRKNGRANISNLLEGQTLIFTYVTPALKEQDWIFYIDKIDSTDGKVILFLKQEGEQASEIQVSLSSPAEIDLDKDGSIDLKISVTEIQGETATLSFEKTETFIVQEQQLIEKRKWVGILITIVIIAVILIVGLTYFITRKSPKKEETNMKRYSKK